MTRSCGGNADTFENSFPTNFLHVGYMLNGAMPYQYGSFSLALIRSSLAPCCGPRQTILEILRRAGRLRIHPARIMQRHVLLGRIHARIIL